MTVKKIQHCMHVFLLRLAMTGLSFLLTLAGLEVILRFFPVQTHLPPQSVTAESPVARYHPNRSFVYSTHWNFQDINYGRTNAQGFVCDFDYDTEDNRPLIAVIGDSYIEARMVQFSQTMQEQIRVGLGNTVRVYAFAMNGAALSQHLAFAKMARDTYQPDMMVVTIVSNDFNESFSRYQSFSRFHYFVKDAHGNLIPQLQKFNRPTRLQEMLSHSALVRYAYFHLRILDTPRTIRRLARSLTNRPPKKRSPSASASPAEKCRAGLEIPQQAVDAFLRLLPEYAGLPPERIVLVLDGQRLSLYRGLHKIDACFESMRHYISKHATVMGYEVLDMHPVFKRDFQAHRQRFDFIHDAHWNARAHGLAADAVLSSRTFKHYFNDG